MNPFRQLRRGIAALVQPRRADRDVADEVAHYAQELERELRAGGMPADDARRHAHARLGKPELVREEVRTSGWEHVLETFMGDLQYALRRLRHSPMFTIVGVVTLAVGIGASTAIFSAIEPILLRPLPYPDAGRVVAINDRDVTGATFPATFGTYVELSTRARLFESIGVSDGWRPSLITEVDPERLQGERVSTNYFHVLGMSPGLGREFADDEAIPGGPRVAILSDRLLQRRFNGDRSIVGRTVNLDGVPYQIVGVMPRGFTDVIAPRADIWSPLQDRRAAPPNSREWGHHYQMIGRVRKDVSIDAAAREIQSIAANPLAELPRPQWASLQAGMSIEPLQATITAGVRPVLYAVLGAVLLLLAIACVNVTNLLIARGAQRTPEFAVRAALGAGGRRLVRQLLTESLVLALLGGLLGLVVARVGVRAIISLSPPNLPRLDAIGLSATAFVFALLITTIVGIVVGLAPAMAARRADFRITSGSTRTTSGGRGVAASALVVAEMALALVLLVGAGLLIRSLDQLYAVKSGIDANRVLTMQIVASGPQYRTNETRLQFFENVVDAVRQVPGVTHAAFTSLLPLSGDGDGYGFQAEKYASSDRGDDGNAQRSEVSPGYFEAMRIPLVRGRLLSQTDVGDGAQAIVLNESFAKRIFGDMDPIGQHMRFGPDVGSGRPWGTVVGVVGDVRLGTLALPPTPTFYVTGRQWSWVDNVQSLVVRTSGDPLPMADAIKRAVWSVDRTQPIQRIATMQRTIERSVGQRTFASLIFQAFALAALLLAAVGIYGLMASAVSQRTREMGIRAALGATAADIVRQVLRRGVALTACGLAIGAVGAAAASRLLETMLFGVSRIDPITYGGVAALLVTVAVVACWVPARRAASIDPAMTLRSE